MKSFEVPHGEITSPKGEREPAEEKYRKYLGKLQRSFLPVVLVMASLLPREGQAVGPTPQAEVTTAAAGKSEKAGQNIPTEEQVDSDQGSMKIEGVDIYPTSLFKDNETGERVFNFGSLIAPFQVEVSTERLIENTLVLKLPYEYSRLFNEANPLKPAEYEKLASYVDKQIREQLGTEFVGLAWSQGVHEQQFGKESAQDIEITGIKAIGMASPESHVQGEGSIVPGSIEIENINLGKMRGQKAVNLAIGELKNMGIEVSAASIIDIKAEELQFSEAELDKLLELAGKHMGVASRQGIMALITEYNSNKIDNAEDTKVLDEIIGSKRMAQVEITVKGKEKKIILLPLPLLLLLPLLRRRPPKTPDDPEPDPEPRPQFGFSERQYAQSLVDDLGNFFDHKITVERGLNYRQMCVWLENNYDQFDNDEARLDYLENELLRQWREHDIKARREAGWGDDGIDHNLDYENQPEQIEWAKAHAYALLSMVRERIGGSKDDYIKILWEKIREIEMKDTVE